jgi:two-component system NtrC family response regulator
MATTDTIRLVGASRALRDIKGFVSHAGSNRHPVAIWGETGVGKELVARLIHAASGRKTFVAVNCSTLCEGFAVSELFGHERGAYTSADTRRKGLVKLADGGTLFLDEVGDLQPDAQPMLFRMLDDGSFIVPGSAQEERVDVRIIAASNLIGALRRGHGSFRRDLYYRLAVLEVTVPPLRERPEDIKPLAEYFGEREAKTVTEPAVRILEDYDWPGNVRELKSQIIRAAGEAHNHDEIVPEHVRLPPRMEVKQETGDGVGLDIRVTLAENRDRQIRMLYERYGGNVIRMAETLGLSRQNVYGHLKRLGLATAAKSAKKP